MMKKATKILLVLVLVMTFGLFLERRDALADVFCNAATVMKVGPVATGTGKVFVNLRNDSGANVGSWSSGTLRQFGIDDSIKNQALAVMLTAMTMDKKIWVQTAGTGEVNSLINIVYLNK